MTRKSEYSKNRRAGRGVEFAPTLQEWTEACEMFPKDIQVFNYFSIGRETFYGFIDKLRYEKEQTGESAFLDVYLNGKKKLKKLISNAFVNKIHAADTGSIIFGMKAYNGVIEQKDIEHIELKKQQLALKSNEFLTEMAKQFGLDKSELKVFADKYFAKLFDPNYHDE